MTWVLRSKDINETVEAPSANEAFNALRDFGKLRFGLAVEAALNGDFDNDEDCYAIRTSLLMARWGRDADSAEFSLRAKELGLGYIDDVATAANERRTA